MSTSELDIGYMAIDIISEDRDSIPYRKNLRSLGGSVTATILLQQIIWRARHNGWEPFYKFRAPCNHELYRLEDSWIEELGFSVEEFDAAIKRIGTKITAGSSKAAALAGQTPTSLVIYWTDTNRITWYYLNRELLGKLLLPIYLVDRQSPTSTKMGKPNLPTKIDKPNLPIKTEITSEITDPEITTETTNTNSAREDEEPTHPTPRAREKFSQNPPSENQTGVQSGWVGSAPPSSTLDSSLSRKEKSAQSKTVKSKSAQDGPQIAANGDPKSLSAPAPARDYTPAQALAYAILTAPEVGGGSYAPNRYAGWVSAWIGKEDPLDLIRSVAAWWVEKEAGGVDVGALQWRLDNQKFAKRVPPAFLESEFYRRHYPLTQQQQEVRQRTLDYTGKAPPHPLGALLDKLPAPVWEVS